ncbi:hypothetical protein A4X09_0g3142 [Tilletia walkeri]|uniref:Polysaccharide lyase 14 domain-containing protein n=1 Tax=Tilletia walkeri TaxID=117179 RepID=A0A8X7NAW3_9BASI|nr:hypothetical protein A4X09_0g3142 [Tilletia walkeri]
MATSECGIAACTGSSASTHHAGLNFQHHGHRNLAGQHGWSAQQVARGQTADDLLGSSVRVNGASDSASDSGSSGQGHGLILSKHEIARYYEEYKADFDYPQSNVPQEVYSMDERTNAESDSLKARRGSSPAIDVSILDKAGLNGQILGQTQATFKTSATGKTTAVATGSTVLATSAKSKVPSAITVQASLTTATASKSPTPSCSATTPPIRKWALPKRFSSLKYFAPIFKYGKGQANLKVREYGLVDSAFKPVKVPVTVAKTTPSSSSGLSPSSSGKAGLVGGTKLLSAKRDYRAVDADDEEDRRLETRSPRSVIEVLYPKGSSNPGGDIVGGAEFYALTTLGASNSTGNASCPTVNLNTAKKVTFKYSVWFPPNFQFVKGGKLPGLYGGRESCSGGDSAQDCWSSRMMWRAQGAGELYLYVPQALQGPGICEVPPLSECNSAYGISVGRGSFKFHTGAWTHIQQTLTMGSHNSSRPDGALDVVVDGVRRFSFDKVYYPARTRGLFFSTFFGGHGDDWASPVDQKAWFRDFSISIDA